MQSARLRTTLNTEDTKIGIVDRINRISRIVLAAEPPMHLNPEIL
jgi:hypothetical protein